jgi:hypothetical protein
MSEKEAIIILIQHNDWRRGNDDLPMTDPKLLGIAIDTIIKAWKERNNYELERYNHRQNTTH